MLKGNGSELATPDPSERIKWLIIHSTGRGYRDGECMIYEGTHSEAQQFVADTTYGESRTMGLFSLMLPFDIVMKAINKDMLTLEKLDLDLSR